MEPERHAGQDRHDKVVPVNAPNPLLVEALLALEVQARSLKDAGPLSSAFCHWILDEPFPVGGSTQVADDLRGEIAGGGRSIHAVAALGFMLAIDPCLVSSCRESFLQGVDWLTGRSASSQTSVAILMQPLAHTGVQVGLLTVADSGRWQTFRTWFSSLMEHMHPWRNEDWRQQLLAIVRFRAERPLDERPKLSPVTLGGVIYAARGLVEVESEAGDGLAGTLIDRIKSLTYSEPEQAAMDLVAFRFLAQGALQVDLRAPRLEDVGALLRRLPAGLRRWTWDLQKKTPKSTPQKWAIENEYHFQNLLCAVLTPVFADLRDEEWLSSVGQKKPRADLVIPSLHLVVEVKYWRVNISSQELISQIAEDVSLYLKRGSPYRKVLPVIWDQGRRTEQYDLLIAGLNEIRDVIMPVLVPQPAFMA